MTNDLTPPPIAVNASPTPAQIESALRDALKAAGVLAGTLGFAHLAGSLSGLLQFVGPAAAVIGWGLSQWNARKSAQTKVALAMAMPSQAVLK